MVHLQEHAYPISLFFYCTGVKQGDILCKNWNISFNINKSLHSRRESRCKLRVLQVLSRWVQQQS